MDKVEDFSDKVSSLITEAKEEEWYIVATSLRRVLYDLYRLEKEYIEDE